MQHTVPLEQVMVVQEARIAALVKENTMLEALVNHLTVQINSLRADIEKHEAQGDHE